MSDALHIQLGARSYPIRFGSDLTADLAAELKRLRESGRKLALVTDENVLAAQREFVAAAFGALPTLALPAGESTKSLSYLGRTLDFLAASQVDRAGIVVALGGGVIGDLAGYAAASFLRGVDFYQVPTTLLSMVDSSVGGKTGINLAAGKNLVGAFHQPKAVFVSTHFLATLPPREFAAGMAEVIKYGLLADRALFEQLEREPLSMRHPKLGAVIRRCCELKAKVVEADEFERAAEGGRALLNLGHTFGHAIERVTGYREYLHGEAVAIGLSAAARLSRDLGCLDAAAVARVDAAVAAHALAVRLRAPLPAAEILQAMQHDKKVRAGLPRFVVLRRLGEAATQENVAPALVESALREVGAV